MNNFNRIIVSQTDGITHVVLTLPLCGLLKEKFPETKIYFLARNYTKAVVECCSHVDMFLSYDEFEKSDSQREFLKNLNADVMLHVCPRKSIAYAAKDADIPLRIGTSHRGYHNATCNERIDLGSKNSKLHEMQLNMALLSPFRISSEIPIESVPGYVGFQKIKSPPPSHFDLIDENKFNLILHPKSPGSNREWNIFNFSKLIELLPANKFKIFISGSVEDSSVLSEWINKLPSHVTDISGTMPLDEFISFINLCDGMVAANTGPLHIAAALGKHALGLFAPIRPFHPGRWAPLGEKAEFVLIKKNCSDCENIPQACKCIRLISPADVSLRLRKWGEKKLQLRESESLSF